MLSDLVVQFHMDSDVDGDILDNDKEGGWPFQNFVEQLILDMFDPGMTSSIAYSINI